MHKFDLPLMDGRVTYFDGELLTSKMNDATSANLSRHFDINYLVTVRPGKRKTKANSDKLVLQVQIKSISRVLKICLQKIFTFFIVSSQ